MIAPARGYVGTLTLDEIRQLRAANVPTADIAERAGVSRDRVKDVLGALGIPYPQGGARAGAGRPRRRRCERVVHW